LKNAATIIELKIGGGVNIKVYSMYTTGAIIHGSKRLPPKRRKAREPSYNSRQRFTPKIIDIIVEPIQVAKCGINCSRKCSFCKVNARFLKCGTSFLVVKGKLIGDKSGDFWR
jgi:hypothetical protein